MKLQKPENVGVTFHPDYGREGGSFSLHWNAGEFRYHVWITAATMSVGGELFKNPPSGTKVHDRGYFRTRHLDLHSAASKVMFDYAWRVAVIDKLFDAARGAPAQAEVDRVARARGTGGRRSRGTCPPARRHCR